MVKPLIPVVVLAAAFLLGLQPRGTAAQSTTAPASDAAASPPNIVLILADDFGWMDVAFNGSDYYHTPRLDALSKQSLFFTDAYANAANCAPSRAALLSGMYAPRTGVYTVDNPARGKAKNRRLVPAPNTDNLSGDVVTIAEVLKARGYATAVMGKYHVGELDTPSDPQNQGFDVNVGASSRGHPKRYFSPYNLPRIEDGPDGEYLTDRLAAEGVKYIKQAHDKPFFLYFPCYAIHGPDPAAAGPARKGQATPRRREPEQPRQRGDDRVARRGRRPAARPRSTRPPPRAGREHDRDLRQRQRRRGQRHVDGPAAWQ